MSWKIYDYRCTKCGRVFESLEQDAPVSLQCDCGGVAERQMPAPLGRVKIAEVKRGKSDPRPPGTLDTRPIARAAGVDI